MSTATAIPVSAATRLSSIGILRSEWIKLRSLRSTVWSYAIVILVSLGMAWLMSATLPTSPGSMPAADQASRVIQASTFGVYFGQMVVAVLGVLVISGEYSTGMIRSTLAAVPRRLPALWSKAVVLFVTTFVVGAISTFGAFLIAAPILAGKDIHANLLDSDVFVPLLGGALFLAMVAVFALGLGTILRNSAGGISAVLGVLLLLPIVMQLIPADWAHDLIPYLISSSGFNMFGTGPSGPTGLEPWQNFLITAAWVVVSLAGAAALLKRRDA